MGAVSGLPGLPASARETAILAIGSQYQAPYEIYAHERVALKNTSLTKEQIDAIKNGRKPEGLGREESVAFDVAVELAGGKRLLERERWVELVGCVGREGALALLQVCGLYGFTCLLLNGYDIRLPEGEGIWE